MIKVECVSCKAPYDLDERRIPEKGMKMRCPKCGTSFQVTRQGVAAEGAAPAAPAPIAAPAPAAVAPPFGGGGLPKGTMVGHAAPAPLAPPAPIAAPPPVSAMAATIVAPLAAPAPAPAAAPPAFAGGVPKGTMLGVAPGGAASAAKGLFGGGGAAAPAVANGVFGGGAPAAAKGLFGGAAAPGAPAAPASSHDEPANAEPPTASFDPAELAAALRSSASTAQMQAPPEFDGGDIDGSELSVSNMRLDQLPAPKREVSLPRPSLSPGYDDPDLPAPRAASSSWSDADLPAAKGQGFAFGDLDLPATKASSADLPALKGGGADLPALKGGGADLPALRGGGADLPALRGGGADLPALKGGNVDLPAPKFGAIDLPAPKGDGIDLPAPKFGSVDLPAPKSGSVDLPTPKHSADLPAAKGQADLPARRDGSTRFGEIDLPAPRVESPDLPAPRNDLPALASDDSSFADLMLDLPDLPQTEAQTTDDVFGDIELPPPRPSADMVSPRERTVQGNAVRVPTQIRQAAAAPLAEPGDSELPPSLMGDESSFDDLNLDGGLSLSEPPAPPRRPAAPTRPAVAAPMNSMPPSLMGEDDVPEYDAQPEPEGDLLGSDDLADDEDYDDGEEYEDGDGFGEEEFAGEEGEDDEEAMEFGIEGEEGDREVAPEALRRQRGEDFEARQAVLRKRTVTLIIRLAIVLVVLTGASASLVFTEHGLFGVYYWEQWLPDAGTPEFARETIEKAEKMAATDTYVDVQRSLKELGSARKRAGINRNLLSRGLLHESLYVVRFGDNPAASSRAAAILKRLEERSGRAPEMDLARAADAARRKAYAEVARYLGPARQQGPRDPYVELLAGEVAFVQNKIDEAEKAFGQALKLGGGARAQWGLARVALSRDDKDAQTAAIYETLKLSPMHVEARIAEARVLWQQGKDERSMHLLRVALGLEPTEEDRYLWSSKGARASGYSVLGYVHESRGRLHLARDAYDQSLKADAYRVEALLGSGRVLLREKRPNDALPRFESALTSATQSGVNPIVLSGRTADTEAQLGIGRVLLALQRAPEAKAKLLDLSTKLPNDPEVMLALGQTEESLSNIDKAEEFLRKSISLSPKKFDGYLALSQLFFHKGDAARASEVLNEAAGQVEETAHMRRMLGQSELARNRLDSAVHELRRAVELDPYDVEAQFSLGIALRKRGDLDQARSTFEGIAKRDPDYAGLAEQRGLLLEAEGKYEEAVDAYRIALDKEAGDTSLVLRLGAAQVLANKLDDAEQTLAKVIREMPNSAEAEYFIGRIAFARGRTPDALAHFDRAIALDNMKGEYHLYVARATFDMGNFGRTLEEAELAIARDPGLGDAFWVRAMVRLRMSAVKDSLKDLDKALRLNPMRIEAYYTMAQCYEQLRQLPEAIRHIRTALGKDETRGEWWYKLGVLHSDSGAPGEAKAALKRALELGEVAEPMPWWLPDAHRLSGDMAENEGSRQAAIRHYKRYLEIAQSTALDYSTVKKALFKWGVELEDD